MAVLALVGCSSEARLIPVCDTAPTPAPIGNAGTTQLPLEVQAENGVMRYTMPVTIGDTTLDVFFDTGSSGVRVLAPAVADRDIVCVTSTEEAAEFHSGLVLDGVLAYASIGLDGVATGPIPIQYVTDGPDSVFGPYQVVFGVGMRTSGDSIGNPLAQLAGAPSFAVESPPYGETTGTLELAPDVTRFATFELPVDADDPPLANGVAACNDRYGLPACLHDTTAGVDYCAPAELDTGNPPIYVEWAAHTGGTSTLPTGTTVDVDVGSDSARLGTYSFTVGATPTPGVDEVEIESTTGASFMNLGTSVFFQSDVLFDQSNCLVGLARPATR